MKGSTSDLLPYAAALAVGAVLAATGIYQYSYDATTHIFFASHYAQSWFSTWDARWYGGMSVTGYPPLVHQLMALVSLATGAVLSFGAVAAVAPLLLIWGAKRFARSLGMESGALPWLVALSPGVFLFLFGFGQLPEVVSSAFILASGGSLSVYAASGRRSDLLTASLFASLSIFCNLEAPLIGLPAVGLVALAQLRKPRDILRMGEWVGLTSLVASPVLYEVLLFIWSTPHQAPIPQETRGDILAGANSIILFWGIYGLVVFLLPFGVYAAVRRKKRVYAALTVFLVAMGLGGTTPLPRLVLGPSLFNFLTYEKFSFLAMLLLSVIVGVALDGVWRSKGSLFMAAKVMVVAALVLSTAGVLVNNYQVALPSRGPDLGSVAGYLNSQSGTGYWVTLGVGPIGRELSLETSHPTLDGGFNTARRIPALAASGVDSIDNAKYFPNGSALIGAVLGGGYGVRWAIVGDQFYVPFLELYGYTPVLNVSGPLPVTIWESPGYAAGYNATYTVNNQTSYVWGAYPLLVLAGTVVAWAVERDRSRREGTPSKEEP